MSLKIEQRQLVSILIFLLFLQVVSVMFAKLLLLLLVYTVEYCVRMQLQPCFAMFSLLSKF
jgi:hypothetical protein